jgi:hypothetical protein
MKPRTKLAIVAAGYGLAFAAARAAGWAYNVRVAQLPDDTSGGMYAGGELLCELATFFAAALPTTMLALWFARANRRFWQVVAGLSLAFAAVGLFAVLAPPRWFHRHPSMWLDLFAIAQLLGVPLWTVAFALFAAIAPTRTSRRLLLAAIGIELAIAACAAIHWFVPSPPL